MFSPEYVQRFSRQISLDEVGVEGMRKISQAKILVIGLGGLGSPALIYLASAGVGTLGLLDYDRVELSNLPRQILFDSFDLGKRKVDAAKEHLQRMHPALLVQIFFEKIEIGKNLGWFQNYDLVLDATDNFPAKYQINQACVQAKIPLISASFLRWHGQIVFLPFPKSPCLACLFPPQHSFLLEEENCSLQGVLAPTVGILGNLQALLALDWILDPKRQDPKLLLFDFKTLDIEKIETQKQPFCPVCSFQKAPLEKGIA